MITGFSLNIPYFLDFFLPSNRLHTTCTSAAKAKLIPPSNSVHTIMKFIQGGWATRCKSLISHTTVCVTPRSLLACSNDDLDDSDPMPAMKKWRMVRLV